MHFFAHSARTARAQHAHSRGKHPAPPPPPAHPRGRERQRQRGQLAQAGHVGALGEVVVAVGLNAVQDLAVQDERRPAPQGRAGRGGAERGSQSVSVRRGGAGRGGRGEASPSDSRLVRLPAGRASASVSSGQATACIKPTLAEARAHEGGRAPQKTKIARKASNAHQTGQRAFFSSRLTPASASAKMARARSICGGAGGRVHAEAGGLPLCLPFF